MNMQQGRVLCMLHMNQGRKIWSRLAKEVAEMSLISPVAQQLRHRPGRSDYSPHSFSSSAHLSPAGAWGHLQCKHKLNTSCLAIVDEKCCEHADYLAQSSLDPKLLMLNRASASNSKSGNHRCLDFGLADFHCSFFFSHDPT